MVKARNGLPRRWPHNPPYNPAKYFRARVIDKEALRQALDRASEAAQERDPDKRRDLEQEAIRLWNEAYGRGRVLCNDTK